MKLREHIDMLQSHISSLEFMIIIYAMSYTLSRVSRGEGGKGKNESYVYYSNISVHNARKRVPI